MAETNLEDDHRGRESLIEQHEAIQAQLEQKEVETKQLKAELEKYAAALHMSEQKIQRIREVL